MTTRAVLEESPQRRYADTDTATLMAMWELGDRTEWAEAVLRRELRSRGVSRLELHAIAMRRPRPPDPACPMVRHRFWRGSVMGWLVSIVSAVAAYELLQWIGGHELGVLGLTLVAAIHGVVLIHRLAVGRTVRTMARRGT